MNRVFEITKPFRVPAVKVIFPMTEHMFDFLLPQLSPPAQSALYDVDRFLALLNNMG